MIGHSFGGKKEKKMKRISFILEKMLEVADELEQEAVEKKDTDLAKIANQVDRLMKRVAKKILED